MVDFKLFLVIFMDDGIRVFEIHKHFHFSLVSLFFSSFYAVYKLFSDSILELFWFQYFFFLWFRFRFPFWFSG
jgi:hypothetical protein